MVFSSLIFAFFFLPPILCLYFLAKDQYRNYILLAASIIFYAYGEPKFVFIMIASIAVNYMLALWVARSQKTNSEKAARSLLILAVIINLVVLYIYKYLDFSTGLINIVFRTQIPSRNIVLPIGISFFTFQALSYVIDVYRKTVPVQKNPMYLALYISFFPQLIAGPIVRYSTFERQITGRRCTVAGFAEGGRRFLLGFCKKIILANNLSIASDAIFSMAEASINTTNPLLLWIGSICFSLQILFDFSGYSDMAIGLARLFGFEFEENFNYPYIARSATDFWRRWHISLSQWFRDYVYIPLGGSRTTPPPETFA